MKTIYNVIFGRFNEDKAIERNLARIRFGETDAQYNARNIRHRRHMALANLLVVLGFAGVIFALCSYPG